MIPCFASVLESRAVQYAQSPRNCDRADCILITYSWSFDLLFNVHAFPLAYASPNASLSFRLVIKAFEEISFLMLALVVKDIDCFFKQPLHCWHVRSSWHDVPTLSQKEVIAKRRQLVEV